MQAVGPQHQFAVMLQVANNKEAVDNLIDDKLVDIRRRAGLNKEQLSFGVDAPGGFVRDDKFKDGQLVVVFNGERTPDAIIDALKPFGAEIKAAVKEAGLQKKTELLPQHVLDKVASIGGEMSKASVDVPTGTSVAMAIPRANTSKPQLS